MYHIIDFQLSLDSEIFVFESIQKYKREATQALTMMEHLFTGLLFTKNWDWLYISLKENVRVFELCIKKLKGYHR